METYVPPRLIDPAVFVPLTGAPSASAVASMILSMTYSQISALILTGGGCIWKAMDLSIAQLNSMNSSPVQFLPALPAGQTYMPVYDADEQVMGATPFVAAAPTVQGVYAGLAAVIVPSNALSNVNGARVTYLESCDSGSISSPNVATTRAYNLQTTADTTGGSGSFRAIVGYCVGPGL